MGFLTWTAIVGGLLLLMSLASSWIHRGPVTSFGLYLIAGIVLGPWVLGWVHIDLIGHPDLAAHITEITMAASLFITGLKLRLPLRDNSWRVGFRLAFPAMLLTVGAMTLIIHFLTPFNWPLSLAFAAIIAPTDPVLASLISVNDARDDDALRVSLSSEAGMNDGSALPLLMLAVVIFTGEAQPTGSFFAHWALVDVLWAIGMGLGIGFVLGRVIGMLATHLRHANKDVAPNDFLALALMALSYAAAQSIDASGFLSAFAAGVGLRRAELGIIHSAPANYLPENDRYAPAEELINPNQRSIGDGGLVKSVGLVVSDALSFGDTIERLLAAGMVMVLGITLADHWNLYGLLLGVILFVVVRPLAVWLATIGSGIPAMRRLMIGWLGIRGIGSLNYIAFAWVHGMSGENAQSMVDMALTLVVASIVLHGITVTPLLNWRTARQAARQQQAENAR